MNPSGMNRRALLSLFPASALAQGGGRPRPVLCLFSKHAAKLNYAELGKFAREANYDGIDLTVRPGGHVLPERVADDLPKAAAAIASAGAKLPMITTGLTDPRTPESIATLRTAGTLKIPYWKVGYYRYTSKPDGSIDLNGKMAEVQSALKGFTELSRLHGVTAGFHNHSGNYVGSPVWDSRQLLAGLDSQYMGYYFDPAHAVAEGGLFGWQASLEIASANLKMVAVKDFYWEKNKSGKWTMRWCPLGQGMVDWQKVFARFAAVGFRGPITVHTEYHTADELQALADDGAVLRKLVDEAYR
jgi:sugar phosphate isomerase/epimerase